MIPSRLLLPANRLYAALTDPARRERTIVAVLAAYVVAWTLYGVIAKASQDIHFDMAELFAWSREPALGYPKHPPLAAWLVRAWFAVFPAADWAYYLLAMTVVGVALWIAWRLFALFLDGEKRVIALALLMLVPFYNFHALKFNPNTVLLLLWAVTTLWFIRSFETRAKLDAALAGLAAAACMLGKYWSVFFLAGLGLAALIDSRRAAYFRSPAPWITIAVGALALAPHVIWLFANDFLPFSYALEVHGGRSIATITKSAGGYLIGALGYIALPTLLALAATQPSRAAIADVLVPATPERQLVAWAFWLPLLIPAPIAPLLGIEINSLWTMSAWTLVPVVLLSSPLTSISQTVATRIVAVAIFVPFAFLAASPFIAGAIHRGGIQPLAAHGHLLAEQVTQAWKQATDRPLQVVGGDAVLSYAVSFYAPDRPSTFPELEPRAAPWIDQPRLAHAGIALVCPLESVGCVKKVEAYAGDTGRRREVDLARSYLGNVGPSARYLIIIVPPRQ